MNFTHKIIYSSLTALTLLSGPTFAAGPYYGGVSLGSSDINNCRGDCGDTGIKLLGGYQVTPIVGVEIAYTDLGRFGNSVRASALGISALGKLPLQNNFSLFGRLGVNNARLKGGGVSDSSLELGYGLGASYAYSPIVDFRVEWERIAFDSVDGSLLSIGAVMKF
jgi:OmpA-OmpF porin, OOP family